MKGILQGNSESHNTGSDFKIQKRRKELLCHIIVIILTLPIF